VTADQAKQLRPGDIVEFRGELCTWIAKLIKLETYRNGDTDWVVTTSGMGGFGTRLLKNPLPFFVVGHSDYRV